MFVIFMKIKKSNKSKNVDFLQGTTGLPKGVMLTHFNLVANACQSVMGHPDIQICGENEGETGFSFSSSYFRNPEWGQILPKTYSVWYFP